MNRQPYAALPLWFYYSGPGFAVKMLNRLQDFFQHLTDWPCVGCAFIWHSFFFWDYFSRQNRNTISEKKGFLTVIELNLLLPPAGYCTLFKLFVTLISLHFHLHQPYHDICICEYSARALIINQMSPCCLMLEFTSAIIYNFVLIISGCPYLLYESEHISCTSFCMLVLGHLVIICQYNLI